jgi:glutamine synthetase adenylyltransferase
MVDDGKITRQKAHDITATFWPDEKDMLTIANQMGGLTAAQFKRALEIKRKKPKEKIEKIIEEAQKPPLLVTFKVTFTRDEADMLEAEADRRSRKINKKVTVTDLIHDAVRRFFIPAS